MGFSEIFYFEPTKYYLNINDINEVLLIGEFNEWGKDKTKNKNYKLTKDKTGRWIGLFDVQQGTHPYKFLINNENYYPVVGNLYYSTSATPEWSKELIWYQFIPDRFYRGRLDNPVPNLIDWNSSPTYFDNFGGDFKGIIEKIDYLKNLFEGSLNNTGFYFTPIQKSLASNHKYWIEDFLTIDPQFGTEEDFKELVDVIHHNGGKIIIDTVYNHSGLNHYAFIDCLKNGTDSKYWGWYRHLANLSYEKIRIPVLQDYIDDNYTNLTIENDPRSDDFNPEKESFFSLWNGKYKFPLNDAKKYINSAIDEIIMGQPFYKLVKSHTQPTYACWWGLFELPELNVDDPSLREHLFMAAKKFLKLGVDGFRLDVPEILNNAHSFWKEFRQEMQNELKSLGKNPEDIFITGEIWTNKNLTSSFLYPDNLGKPIRFDTIMNYPIREATFNFLSDDLLKNGHDTVEKKGEISVTEFDEILHQNLGHISWGTDTAQMNLFSSHDTRRLRTAIKLDNRLFSALVVQFTFPGSPCIYYGDELGMKGAADPECRASIKWDEIDKEKKISNFYKKLIKIRKENPVLNNAPVYTLLRDNLSKIYAYARSLNGKCIIAIVSKEGFGKGLSLNISHMPFEDIKIWKNLLTGDIYNTENKSIIIKNSPFYTAILAPLEE